MALNSLMHPRNPFKDKKPDFSLLAGKYETFRKQTTKDCKGHVHIDFKNPACLKVLSWALLKDEFDVDVEIPADRLIPTIPLRINYILWLEDILCRDSSVRGIDIGTGAVCVYPIIGAKRNGWSFLATEADATNLEYSRRNIQQNNLEDKIRVVKVSENTSLLDILHDSDDMYDFCMCNPPFYGSSLEAWGALTTRSSDRAEPSSVNTASPVECIHPGGEVEFVREMIITSSLKLKNRVRVYSSMLGKKSSLSKLKEILRENKITNIGSSEFCQGNTMRWGIAWTFDESIQFPKPPSKVKKLDKPRPPLTVNLPSKFDGKTDGFLVSDVAKMVEKLLVDLKVSFKKTDLVDRPNSESWIVTSFENTWTHQRRKRRQLAREQPRDVEPGPKNQQEDICGKDADVADYELPTKRLKEDDLGGSINHNSSATEVGSMLKMDTNPKSSTVNQSSDSASLAKKCCSIMSCNHPSTVSSIEESNFHHKGNDSLADFSTKLVSPIKRGNTGFSVDANGMDKGQTWRAGENLETKPETKADSQDLPLLKCFLTVLPGADSGVAIHLDWISGQNRECMHQLMLYFKNKFQ